MKFVASKQSLRRGLWWTQRVLFVCAISLLGYCGYVMLDTWVFQRRASQDFDLRLQNERENRAAAQRARSAASPEIPPLIGPDGLIGRVEIQRIGLSAVVFEGTHKDTLRHAVGHIASTALPGQPGNVGIAGHRDTFFRPLRDIQRNDIITLVTLRGEYRYRVVSTRIVVPTEISVLNPSESEVLTLVTCYPFYFVGSAPNRFIVRAERIVATS